MGKMIWWKGFYFLLQISRISYNIKLAMLFMSNTLKLLCICIQYDNLLSEAHLSLILSQINWAVSVQHQASDPAPRSLLHCSVYLAPAPVLQSINDRSSLPGHWLVYCSISWSHDQSTCHAILFTNLRIFEFISLQFNVQCSFVIMKTLTLIYLLIWPHKVVFREMHVHQS